MGALLPKRKKEMQIPAKPMDKLTEIMAWKRNEIASRIRPVRERELEAYARSQRSGKSFREALRRTGGLAVISEIKRRSPSAGDIRATTVAPEQARLYYNAQVDAISVLTDEKYFGGTIRDLWDVNDLLGNRDDAPPTLRKDFFVHPIQVLEAAEAGARAILIIVRALSDDEIKGLFEAASLAGIDSLFEVHTEAEVARAVRHGARIIGVNNRDLATFQTDLALTESILPTIPREIVRISESGISTPEDGFRVRAAGADAILVGEALMKAGDDLEELIHAWHDCG